MNSGPVPQQPPMKSAPAWARAETGSANSRCHIDIPHSIWRFGKPRTRLIQRRGARAPRTPQIPSVYIPAREFRSYSPSASNCRAACSGVHPAESGPDFAGIEYIETITEGDRFPRRPQEDTRLPVSQKRFPNRASTPLQASAKAAPKAAASFPLLHPPS